MYYLVPRRPKSSGSYMRKPSVIVAIKLRIREKLRARLEAAAARNRTSMNSEIAQRLEASFEAQSKQTFFDTSQDMQIHWARWGQALHELNKQGDLLRATEKLLAAIDQTQLKDPAIKAATAGVQQAITVIDAAWGKAA